MIAGGVSSPMTSRPCLPFVQRTRPCVQPNSDFPDSGENPAADTPPDPFLHPFSAIPDLHEDVEVRVLKLQRLAQKRTFRICTKVPVPTTLRTCPLPKKGNSRFGGTSGTTDDSRRGISGLSLSTEKGLSRFARAKARDTFLLTHVSSLIEPSSSHTH